jgi:hypothetical protein
LEQYGLCNAVGYSIRMAFDPDGKKEYRGHSDHHLEMNGLFLGDRLDIDLSVIETTDPDEWARYPAWYGYSHSIDFERARAVRLRPYFDAEYAWLPPMLDEFVPEIRHIVAIHIARNWRVESDGKVVDRLREASRDPHWIWSERDNFASGRSGADEALGLLARLNIRG